MQQPLENQSVLPFLDPTWASWPGRLRSGLYAARWGCGLVPTGSDASWGDAALQAQECTRVSQQLLADQQAAWEISIHKLDVLGVWRVWSQLLHLGTTPHSCVSSPPLLVNAYFHRAEAAEVHRAALASSPLNLSPFLGMQWPEGSLQDRCLNQLLPSTPAVFLFHPL